MPLREDLLRPENFSLNFFKENNLIRQKCKSCNKWFWSVVKKDICGDASCTSYNFIGNPIIPGKLKWKDVRKKFINFFHKRGHSILKRYPVVARWKPDTLFTGASIFNFMPWVLNGSAKPPANPLVIDQPSVRFVDIDNVGLGTGRHCTQFSMLAHHAFNNDNKIYWKEETVRWCYEFFTKELKLPANEITFIESIWEGGGNAGPCFEVVSKGNEISTLVFMQFKSVNKKYEPMSINVVDTGYGLERITWASQGTPTIYDSIYPKVIKFLQKESGIDWNEMVLQEYCKLSSNMNVEDVNVEVERNKILKKISKKLGISEGKLTKLIMPYHHIYRIADHTRALVFILGDGVVPSNRQEGYLARLLIRRSLHSLRSLGIEIGLEEIVKRQIDDIKDIYPEIRDQTDDIINMICHEEKKYESNIKNAGFTIKRFQDMLKKSGKKVFDKRSFILLYESYGFNPEIIKEHLNMPYEDISTSDIRREIRKSLETEEVYKNKFGDYRNEDSIAFLSNLPPTKKVYYEYENLFNIKARVIKIFDNLVVLDKTIFYPRGGGAEPDTGEIEGSKVLDVEKRGEIIIHTLDTTSGLKEGQVVTCRVNKKRREGITTHHTATHIINGAARAVLGNHVWQEGTKKTPEKAYLNITHYKYPSEKQINQIEKLANTIVKKNLKIRKILMDRTEAEQKFGFRIYQGGAVPGKKLRIIDIEGWDVEACGGLHRNSTGEVGKILITKVEKPHDGLIRLSFRAGKSSEEWEESRKRILKESAKILGVRESELPKAVKKLFSKWKTLRKKVEQKKKKKIEKLIKGIKPDRIGSVDFIAREIPNADMDQLQLISKNLTKDNTFIILFGLKDKIYVFCSAGKNININAGLMVSKICSELGGRGGGSRYIGQGFGLKKEKIKDVINKIKKELVGL